MIYFSCERCKTETLDRFGGLCIKCDTKIRGPKIKTWRTKQPMTIKRILMLIGRYIKGKVICKYFSMDSVYCFDCLCNGVNNAGCIILEQKGWNKRK